MSTVRSYKPIKSSEFNFELNSYQRKKVMQQNSESNFNSSEKYWELSKILKSQTIARHWLFKIDKLYFVALASEMIRGPHTVSIYISNRKGQYDILDPIAIYSHYLDLEGAIDRFSQEYIAHLINIKDERLAAILSTKQ